MFRATVSPALAPLLVLVAGAALSIVPLGSTALAQSAPPPAQNGVDMKTASPLPVSRLTLYRSGVASVERRGSVSGDQRIDLNFRTENINDILKSLVVLDLSGGSVGEVTYTSQEPLERRLRGLGINLADNPAMGEVLNRLRGVQVRLKMMESEPTGTVINVEKRITIVRGTPGGNHAHLELPWVNLLTDQGVRSYNLTDATGFEILDAKLAADFKAALAAIAQQRSDDSKTVGLQYNGSGTRNVIAAYVQQAPVWKTSYRLVLPENVADKPTLQGWAIVENTSDEDWSNVTLALASGQPSAFQMNLYEPVFTERPWIQVPVPKTLVARAYERGVSYGEEALAAAPEPTDIAGKAAMRSETRGRAPGAPAAGRAMADMYSNVGSGTNSLGLSQALASVAAAATGMTTGQAFFYELAKPVSIGRQQSAMLPIVSQEVSGRRVSIYNANQHPTNPMRGVEVTNDTGLQLIAGPVSVFDSNAYAGDAQLNDVSRNETRLLAYALDQDVTVKREHQVSSEIQAIAIKDRAFQIRRLQKSTASFQIESLDDKDDRTLIIEEAATPGWELVEPKKAKEQTADEAGWMRFEVKVDRKGKATHRVVQQQVTTEAVWVMHVNSDSLGVYAQSGKLSPKVREAWEKAQQLQANINAANAEAQRIETEKGEITNDQNRIRQNMQTIDRASDLYQRLMTKLSQQETRMEELTKATVDARTKVAAAEKVLDDYLGSLNLE